MYSHPFLSQKKKKKELGRASVGTKIVGEILATILGDKKTFIWMSWTLSEQKCCGS